MKSAIKTIHDSGKDTNTHTHKRSKGKIPTWNVRTNKGLTGHKAIDDYKALPEEIKTLTELSESYFKNLYINNL